MKKTECNCKCDCGCKEEHALDFKDFMLYSYGDLVEIEPDYEWLYESIDDADMAEAMFYEWCTGIVVDYTHTVEEGYKFVVEIDEDTYTVLPASVLNYIWE